MSALLIGLGKYCKQLKFKVLCNPKHYSLTCQFKILHDHNNNSHVITRTNLPKYFSSSINFSSKNHLVVNPVSCLHDEPIQIQVKGLSPAEEVTLTSSIKDVRGQTFFTYTHFRADSSGNINLETDESLGGTYSGLFAMGPIMNLLPGPKEHKYLRFMKKKLTHPLKVHFKLIKGHLEKEKAYHPDPLLLIDSVIHERLYMAPGTERIPIREGNIRGTLFLPKGEGPFPGVIDLFGTAGGLIEFRAAQLASRGIAALSLAYFDYEDLPEELESLNISYFEEAVNFLIGIQKVKSHGVAAIGVSKGADLACSMATFIPEVKAAVSINGLAVNMWCPLKTREKTFPALKADLSRGKIVNPELFSSIDMVSDSLNHPETHIPLHEADAEFLFIVGLDDQNVRTDLETSRAVERMKAHGKSNFEVLRYEGAGHLLEPPYSPHSYASYHKTAGVALLWGGSPIQHSAAQIDSWNKIISFVKKVLS